MAVQQPVPQTEARALTDMCVAHLRAPSEVIGYPGETRTLVFDPELSTQEQATYDVLLSVLRSPVSLTPVEWSAIRPHIQTVRDLRQLGRNPFMALTAAERDRMLYDAQAATTTILLALLRD
jgi:hypothetical protein